MSKEKRGIRHEIGEMRVEVSEEREEGSGRSG